MERYIKISHPKIMPLRRYLFLKFNEKKVRKNKIYVPKGQKI